MPEIIKFVNNYETLCAIIVIVIGAINTSMFIAFLFRKERRIFNNLKKKIYLFQTGQEGLQTEYELLKENKLLFHVHEIIFNLPANPNVLKAVKINSIYVVKYSAEYNGYEALVRSADEKGSALIVFSKPSEIIKSHMELFNHYKYYEMCNSVARLLTLIFNFAIIIPDKK